VSSPIAVDVPSRIMTSTPLGREGKRPDRSEVAVRRVDINIDINIAIDTGQQRRPRRPI
jgi:hypothetical protein